MAVQNKTLAKQGCPYCSGKRVNHTNSLATTHPELAKEWHPTKNGDLKPQNVTSGSHKHVWWLGHCGHEWDSKIYNRKNGDKCPYCSNNRLLVGFNDMWTTNPDLAKQLLNPEDGYRYMQTARKRLDFKCVKCNTPVLNKMVCDVKTQKLSCPVCLDNFSIGEKIVYQILSLNNIDFEFDRATHFSEKRRYDFIVNNSIIIETHGLQHYKNTGFERLGGRTLEEEIKNDEHKKNLAIKNNYAYYVINCKNSDYLYIINNFKNSGLMEILDIDEKSFSKIDLESSIITSCWELLDANFKKYEIAKILHIGVNRVTKYAKLRKHLNKD